MNTNTRPDPKPAAPLLGLVALVACLWCLAGCAGRASYAPAYPASPVHPVVITARSQIGVPYRYGGASPNQGFDCSGLVQWTYSRHGISLPRTTDQLARHGQEVGKRALASGDLVFFCTDKKGGLHVAIYTGQGTIIHSPKTGGRVREEPVNTTYWSNRFVLARRIW